MPDSLDQLLDESFGVAPTEAEDQGEPVTEGEPEPIVLDAPLDDTTEASQNVEVVNDDTPLPSEATVDTTNESAPSEELTKAQQLIANQQQLLRNIIAAGQEQQRQAQEEQRLQQLAAEWDELPPDEAAREREKWLVATANDEIARARNELQEFRNAQNQTEYQRKEAEAKEVFLTDLMVEFKFNPKDREIFEELETPEAILRVAEKLKTRRAEQTASAREARAASIRTNEALTTGLTTGGAANTQVASSDFADIDSLLDSVLGAGTV